MIREYTEAVREKLKAQIDEIKSSDFMWLTDSLGDIWLYLTELTGILDISNYINQVDEYHRKVLDQHDTTAARIDRIFENVAAVDSTYQSSFNIISDKIVVLNNHIQALSSSINPANGALTKQTVVNACAKTAPAIEAALTKLDTMFDAAIFELNLSVEKEAFLGVVKDVASTAATIFKAPVDLVTKGPVAFVNDGWKLINNVFMTGEDLVAMAIIPIGWGVGSLIGNKKNVQLKALEYATDYESRTGLADELKGESKKDGDVYDKLSKTVTFFDTASDVYGLYGGIKGAYHSVSDLFSGDLDLVGELGVSDSSDNLEKLLKANTGWKYGTLEEMAEKTARWSNINTGVGYVESLINGEFGKELYENTAVGGMTKKTSKTVTGLLDMGEWLGIKFDSSVSTSRSQATGANSSVFHPLGSQAFGTNSGMFHPLNWQPQPLLP